MSVFTQEKKKQAKWPSAEMSMYSFFLVFVFFFSGYVCLYVELYYFPVVFPLCIAPDSWVSE